MSVYHFFQVDFGGGYLLSYLLVVTGGKQSQLLLCPTEVEFDKIAHPVGVLENPMQV